VGGDVAVQAGGLDEEEDAPVGATISATITNESVANGANAGNLSPISSVGLIMHTQMQKAGLPGHDWQMFAAAFVAHTVVALAAYFLFGGLKLFRAGRGPVGERPPALTGSQWFSLAVLCCIGAKCLDFLIPMEPAG
jgi:hypothetical protein